jgi:hypothetical protein
MDSGHPPADETAQRFATCAAHASPGGPRCGQPTTRLLILTCRAEHGKLVSTCDEHAAIARELTGSGALSVCGLCEDLTGTAEPMTIAGIEPWDVTAGEPPPQGPPGRGTTGR